MSPRILPEYMPQHVQALSLLDIGCCPEADGLTNLKEPLPNHVQNEFRFCVQHSDDCTHVQCLRGDPRHLLAFDFSIGACI
ncbi:hypothetical protein TNCV_514401 [Trichonephila clavipes]|nr:hypothetical protein TNCV_514401 [Trichonephila clavipes]